MYRLHLPGSSEPPDLLAAPPEAKPPGSAAALCGSQCSLVLRLKVDGRDNGGQSSSGGNSNGECASYVECDGPMPDAAVSSLEQLLGMLRVLAPPVKLTMRLKNVVLQVCRLVYNLQPPSLIPCAEHWPPLLPGCPLRRLVQSLPPVPAYRAPKVCSGL